MGASLRFSDNICWIQLLELIIEAFILISFPIKLIIQSFLFHPPNQAMSERKYETEALEMKRTDYSPSYSASTHTQHFQVYRHQDAPAYHPNQTYSLQDLSRLNEPPPPPPQQDFTDFDSPPPPPPQQDFDDFNPSPPPPPPDYPCSEPQAYLSHYPTKSYPQPSTSALAPQELYPSTVHMAQTPQNRPVTSKNARNNTTGISSALNHEIVFVVKEEAQILPKNIPSAALIPRTHSSCQCYTGCDSEYHATMCKCTSKECKFMNAIPPAFFETHALWKFSNFDHAAACCRYSVWIPIFFLGIFLHLRTLV